MDLKNLRLFSMLNEKLQWLGERQRVLAQNVANVNTPGYRARDLEPLDFKSMLKGGGTAAAGGSDLQLAATDPRHVGGRKPSERFSPQRNRADREVTLSGNQVELEAQLERIAETGMDYQAATNLYRKNIDLLKSAIGRGGA